MDLLPERGDHLSGNGPHHAEGLGIPKVLAQRFLILDSPDQSVIQYSARGPLSKTPQDIKSIKCKDNM
jgi:hypothetical protein